MYRVTSDAEGVLFSHLNRQHLYNDEFKKLISSENVQEYLESFIKEEVKKWDFNLTRENFTTDKAIKTWLTLKAFNANKEKVALAYYDGKSTGVAVYKNPDDNKLIESEQFTIENFICGFGVKAGRSSSRIHYAEKEEFWLKANIIDTPFDGFVINKEERNASQLEKNKEAIDEIIIQYIKS